MIITVYNAITEKCEFEYTEDMEPEIFGEGNEDGIYYGPFTIFYSTLDDDEEDEVGTCDYDDRYYAVVREMIMMADIV